MIMKQCELIQYDGQRFVGWIDRDHAIIGHSFDLNLGDGWRSPPVMVGRVWAIERDLDEIQVRQENRRGFGGSIR